MSEDDVLTLIFCGPYAEVVFLKALIESAGIETSFDDLPQRGIHIHPRLFVRRADAKHAAELVEDFRKNGHRTSQ